MKKIIPIMMLISFQSAASDSCFKEKYLPGINNCIKEKIENNQIKLASEYKKIENHFKSSEDHKGYLKDMQKNRKEWTEFTTKFCDLQSYFVDKKRSLTKYNSTSVLMRKLSTKHLRLVIYTK
ncbi:hypothetical protein MED121_16749 [Marinomonas sp. MED121]|uniref:hypothetical protein n=1 Tax=Marinomonas sp. MED121 TaxID=314277 RepID=UPI0000690F4E|nr:hypothetical protein [Marinomonas sp. MED121]EAQ67595.1 hypothetical protein MED121_16749 [Marinomonas sp. MED121]